MIKIPFQGEIADGLGKTSGDASITWSRKPTRLTATKQINLEHEEREKGGEIEKDRKADTKDEGIVRYMYKGEREHMKDIKREKVI